ncbi:MAG: sensor histidine kinase [Kineosporiaceae bacterium]
MAAWPEAGTGPLLPVLTGLAAVIAVAGMVSLVLRFLRQDAAGRAQIKWLVWAVTVVLVREAVQGALPRALAVTGLTVLPLLLPVAVGLAVSRFRLYDVDLVLSRTATYAVLTALLTAGYLGASLALGVRSDAGRGYGALGTLLVVALVATPLRVVLQRTLDRWLLGDRSPQVAVGRLTRRLRDTIAADTVPSSVVRTVRESLRVPYARLAVADEEDLPLLAVEDGRPGPATDIPVSYAGRRVGTLTVGWRTLQEPLGDAELRMLRTLSEAAAPALDGLLLAAELRRARQRAATAREEERDRLSRDLHDGLGPTLAGITLGLDAVRNFVDEGDRTRAGQAVDRLRELASGATDDIRSLVRGLGPGALEAVGLVETIQRHARVAAAGIEVHVEVDGDLAALPEAVEVAALHIALEALTNVRRHSAAHTCWVRLARRGEQLEVRVDDDGRGPVAAPAPGGLGRSSMRTRAEELGGTSSWGASPRGGVSVQATLPVAAVVRG